MNTQPADPFPYFAHSHPVMNTPAIWHVPRAEPRERYAVVLFRREFTLSAPVKDITLWTTAAMRFELYLDGVLLARGPSRSDPTRWGVVPVPVARIPAGKHVLAARIVHFGPHAGEAQMGGPAFFLLCAQTGDAELDRVVSTSDAWRCCEDKSRTPVDGHVWNNHHRPMVIGCCDCVRGPLVPWGWNLRDFDHRAWPTAQVIVKTAYDPWGNLPLGHVLRPDPLPPMEELPQRMTRVAECPPELRRAAERFIAGRGPLTIPPRRETVLVLDRGELTNAYVFWQLSGGKDSSLNIIHAEAPYTGEGHLKPRRDITHGMHFYGPLDEFWPDGGTHRTFDTTWLRPFRYLHVTIRTADEPLVLEDLRLAFTGFPLRPAAKFTVRHPEIPFQQLWDVSWRTIRLCAHEIFFDCPHYEQCQFPGDTGVQALFHYLVANDDRLARKAIDDFCASRLPFGLLQCRYPARHPQIIATYSLEWVNLLANFCLYRGDVEFLAPYLPIARDILRWFSRRRRPDGMLGFIEQAPFVDWTPTFQCGNAPQDPEGGSAILTLMLARAASALAGLERAAGFPQLAPVWHKLSRECVRSTLATCWDSSRHFLADTPAKRTFSQHAQTEAVLAGAWPAAKARAIFARALADTTLAGPGTQYYRFSIARALAQVGLQERFFDLLAPWITCLRTTGLTTWPEGDTNPRSDCHAWSATPPIEFLQTILGVRPDPTCIGFSRAILAPALGPLPAASGVVPTPHGMFHVEHFARKSGRIATRIESPVRVRVPALGKELPPGIHRLELPA